MSLEEMQGRLADKQAAPLLEKLEERIPKTVRCLCASRGNLPHDRIDSRKLPTATVGHLNPDPKTSPFTPGWLQVSIVTGISTSAITQLNRALKDQPTNANALFDLGMIRLQGKGDAKGALATWQRLLKNEPAAQPRSQSHGAENDG